MEKFEHIFFKKIKKRGMDIADEILEAIECPVCLEPMTPDHKVLPCQHTFCTACLKDTIGKKEKLLCPECRMKVEVPIDSLPNNIILNRILGHLRHLVVDEPELETAFAPKPIGGTFDGFKPLFIPRQLGPPLPPVKLPPPPPVPTTTTPSSAPVIHGTKNPFLATQTGQPTTSASGWTPSPRSVFESPARSVWPENLFAETQITRQTSGTELSHTTATEPVTRPLSVPPTIPSKTSLSSIAPKLPDPNTKPIPGPHQIYRALYDYTPAKADELQLMKGELYIVVEKCEDGWLKGSSFKSLRTGVFPGNYVQHVKDEAAPTLPPRPSPGGGSKPAAPVAIRPTRRKTEPARNGDLIDFTADFEGVFGTNSNIVPPNVTWTDQDDLASSFSSDHDRTLDGASGDGGDVVNGAAAAQTTPPVGVIVPRVTRYIAIQSYPASSEYELELQIGDIIQMTRLRRDGWCKGFQERTGKTGLFPFSFVARML